MTRVERHRRYTRTHNAFVHVGMPGCTDGIPHIANLAICIVPVRPFILGCPI
jgi:hypothetical protein